MLQPNTKTTLVLLSVTTLLLCTQTTMAQRGRGNQVLNGTSHMQLASLDQVQSELKLTDEQKEKLEDLSQQLRDARRELFQGGGDRAAAREKLTEKTEEFTAKLMDSLDDSQRQRMHELYLQVNDSMALANKKIADMLSITEEQKEKLAQTRREIRATMRESMQNLRDLSPEERREKLAKFRSDVRGKLASVLTDDQRKKLEEMKGKLVEIDMSQLSQRRRRN